MKPVTIQIDAMQALQLDAVAGHVTIGVLVAGVKVFSRAAKPSKADELAVALVQMSAVALKQAAA